MNFALTAHWFDKIERGEKTHEYRAKTAYWTRRINKLSKGDAITFSRGYTKRRLQAVVVDIQYISAERFTRADKEAYAFLRKKCHAFWDIEFTLTVSKED